MSTVDPSVPRDNNGPVPVVMEVFMVKGDPATVDGVDVGSPIYGIAFVEEAAELLLQGLPPQLGAKIKRMVGPVAIVEDPDQQLHVMMSFEPLPEEPKSRIIIAGANDIP